MAVFKAEPAHLSYNKIFKCVSQSCFTDVDYGHIYVNK